MKKLWFNFLTFFTIFVVMAMVMGWVLLHISERHSGGHGNENGATPYLEAAEADRLEDIDQLRERLGRLYSEREDRAGIAEIIFEFAPSQIKLSEDRPTEEKTVKKPEQPKKEIATQTKKRPRIVIVIDDLGLNRARLEQLAALPIPMTLSFLPYADHIERDTKYASEQGHEIFLHMPMQPLSKHIDPGPNYLRVDMKEDELLQKLGDAVEGFYNLAGINNHMGSAFTQHRPSMEIILREIEARELIFLDSRTIQNIVSIDIAKEKGMNILVRDVFIDHLRDSDAIMKQLRLIERVAERFGTAIAIGHPYPETISALQKWLEDKDLHRRFDFVPASAVYKEL